MILATRIGGDRAYRNGGYPPKTGISVHLSNSLDERICKERIVNVKLKDISTWPTEHLFKNWVTERTKTLRKVS